MAFDTCKIWKEYNLIFKLKFWETFLFSALVFFNIDLSYFRYRFFSEEFQIFYYQYLNFSPILNFCASFHDILHVSLYNPNKLSVKCFTCRDVTLFAGILFIGLDSCRTMSIWSPGSEAEKTAYFSTQLASSSFWEKYTDTQIRSHKLGRNIVKIWDPNSICQYPYQFLVGRKRNLEKLNSEVFIYSGAFTKSVHRLHECWWRRKSPHPFFYFANSTGKSLFLGDLLTKKKNT